MRQTAVDDCERNAERPELQQRISQKLGNSNVGPNGRYLVLYGPRGSGKSTCLSFVAHNKRGVIIVRVTESTSEHTIMEAIANSHLINNMSFSEFLLAMKKCAQKRVLSFPPAVVFEVEPSHSDAIDS